MCDSLLQIDLVVPTKTKYLDFIGSMGERIAKELDNFSGDRDALAYQLNLVLTEATVNVIKHACCEKDPKNCVRVTIRIKDDALIIKVYDHGQGFDLDKVPLPDFERPEEGGRGIYIIRSVMDSVTYKRSGDHNVLELIKYLK